MLAKLTAILEKTFTAPVIVASLLALASAVASGGYAFAQGEATIIDVSKKAEEASKRSTAVEEKLATHIAEEVASRGELRRTLRELRIEQFDANMNAYISCIVSKQKDPTLPFECRKPEPPKGD